MNLASPFVKGGSRGILLSHRLLIFNNNFLIDQIYPNPSLLKRGIKRILSSSRKQVKRFRHGPLSCARNATPRCAWLVLFQPTNAYLMAVQKQTKKTILIQP